MARGWIASDGDGVVVQLRVTPKGGRNVVDGLVEDRLRIRVAAPPAEGAANDAARKLIAKIAGVPRSNVELVRGERAREKTFRITGVALKDLEKRLLERSK